MPIVRASVHPGPVKSQLVREREGALADKVQEAWERASDLMPRPRGIFSRYPLISVVALFPEPGYPIQGVVGRAWVERTEHGRRSPIRLVTDMYGLEEEASRPDSRIVQGKLYRGGELDMGPFQLGLDERFAHVDNIVSTLDIIQDATRQHFAQMAPEATLNRNFTETNVTV